MCLMHCGHSLHWSLLVICHPGEVANFEGKNIHDWRFISCLYSDHLYASLWFRIVFADAGCESSLRFPCILHMDSIRGSHKGLKNFVQRCAFDSSLLEQLPLCLFILEWTRPWTPYGLSIILKLMDLWLLYSFLNDEIKCIPICY